MAGNPNYIQMPPDSTGKKVQTWDNSISGNDVHTESTTPTNSAGVELATSGNPLRIDPVGTTTQPVDGTLTNNNAAPAATLLGVFDAIANAAAPSWTEGNQVLQSVDLAGNLRVKLSAGTNVIGHVIVDSGTITTVSTVSAARIVGNAGATLDNASASAAPTNTLQVGGSNGTNIYALNSDTSGNIGVNVMAALPAGTNVIGHIIVDSGTITAVTAITNALPAGTNVIGHVIVDSGTITTVSTVTAVTTVSTVTAVTAITNAVKVTGNAGGAFDAVVNAAPPANAVQIAGLAYTALPSANTATDLTVPLTDKYGRLVVLTNSIRDLVGVQTTAISNSTSETTIVTAIASTFCDITGFQITNATATAVSVTIKDSTAGTTRKVYDLVANGGIVVHFDPPLPQAAVNNNWTATLSAGSINVDINVDYIKNK